jgi:hypothetical protein
MRGCSPSGAYHRLREGGESKGYSQCKTMGQNSSKERDLHVQMLKAMLKTKGSKVRSLQLIQF